MRFTGRMEPSKRKFESYRRAELVCRELRYQLAKVGDGIDLERLSDFVIKWMDVTGKIKYERPE